MKRKEVPLPSQAYIAEMFDYDPLTGICRWKQRPRSHFSSNRGWSISNTACVGKEVGYKRYGKDGRPVCIVTMAQGRWVLLHRLVWVLMNGDDPGVLHIDHINGDPFDNRIENLRLATKAENCRNVGASKNNTSGYKGVTKVYGTKWLAQIMVNRKHYYLGVHDTAEEAHAAYCKAAEEHFGKFARF